MTTTRRLPVWLLGKATIARGSHCSSRAGHGRRNTRRPPRPRRTPCVGFLGGERFADFVREDEGGLVLNVQIAAQLKRAMAFGAVHEDRDGQKDVRIGSLRLAKIVPDVTLN